ncbi:MAG: hypothetical protein RBR53_03645 [Desulforegulaceae bacterium]|nr:hypothetical protein [Desulforegulaceae bacterium]
MLDISVAYNKYKFTGFEFLTWLWFIIENKPEIIDNISPEIKDFSINDKIVIENFKEESVEKITINGNTANLDEGVLAIKKGALVTELKISFKTGEDIDVKFLIKGESLDITGFNVLKYKFSTSPDEIEGSVIEKAYFLELLTDLVDKLFQKFILLRISEDWINKELSTISKWIENRTKSY